MRARDGGRLCRLRGHVAGARTDRTDAPRVAALAGTQAVPGELMEYEVSLRGITVGRVQVAVGEPGELDGRRAIIVKSAGASAGVVTLLGELTWEMTTTIDLDTGYAVTENEKFTAVVAGTKKSDDNTRRWSPESTRHNLHSAAAALRAWQSQIGERSTTDVHIGGATIDVALIDAAREAVGNTPAVRYDGLAYDRFKLSIWISDDDDRVPLRVRTETKFGDITVLLVRYD